MAIIDIVRLLVWARFGGGSAKLLLMGTAKVTKKNPGGYVSVKRVLQRVCAFFGLVLCSHSLVALTLDIDRHFTQRDLGLGLEYVEYDGPSPPVEKVSQRSDWLISDELALNFGFSSNVHWIRFELKNTTNKVQDIIVQTSYPFLDYIDFYQLNSRNAVIAHYAMGDKLPANQRPIIHSHFLAPMSLAAQTTSQILIRIKTSSTSQVPIRISTEEQFLEWDYKRAMNYGVFYGILLMVAVYHLIIFSLIREKSFLFIVCLLHLDCFSMY